MTLASAVAVARRSKTIRLELDRTTEAARATATLRGGKQIAELLREAEAIGAAEVFYVHSWGQLRALVTRRPRREVVRLTVGAPIDGQLAAAA